MDTMYEECNTATCSNDDNSISPPKHTDEDYTYVDAENHPTDFKGTTIENSDYY